MTNKQQICINTRTIAADTLTSVLQNSLKSQQKISEAQFRDQWLKELRKQKTIFPDGWYMPPPHGIGVLFGNTKRTSRHNYKTLRPEDMWPKENIYLDKENGMAYLFASAVDRTTGIIGDFGLTVYFGQDEKIKKHLMLCMKISQEILAFIEVGKRFSDVYDYSQKIIERFGLTNNVTSTTDPAGRDIGHTIPASYLEWSKEEKEILRNATSDWEQVKNMINKNRIFVSPIETTVCQPGMALTLEPRLTSADNEGIPMGSFHTIVAINKNGTKELLTNYDRIFKTVGMDYMLQTRAMKQF